MGSGGKLIVITGPMFAGKTTRLIEELKREARDRKVILFKSQMDNRKSAADVVTHDGVSMPAVVLPDGEGCAKVLKQAAREYEVIGIDEGQFWKASPRFSETIEELVSKYARTVYVALLNKRADGKPFDVSSKLLPLADKVYSLEANCSKCGGPATMTQRIVNGVESFGEEFVVGGSESYEARCREHFVKVGEDS